MSTLHSVTIPKIRSWSYDNPLFFSIFRHSAIILGAVILAALYAIVGAFIGGFSAVLGSLFILSVVDPASIPDGSSESLNHIVSIAVATSLLFAFAALIFFSFRITRGDERYDPRTREQVSLDLVKGGAVAKALGDTVWTLKIPLVRPAYMSYGIMDGLDSPPGKSANDRLIVAFAENSHKRQSTDRIAQLVSLADEVTIERLAAGSDLTINREEILKNAHDEAQELLEGFDDEIIDAAARKLKIIGHMSGQYLSTIDFGKPSLKGLHFETV